MSKLRPLEDLLRQLRQLLSDLIDAIARWVTQLVLIVLQGTGV